MYHVMSTFVNKNSDTGRWKEALADAEKHYAQADKTERGRWQGVIAVIRDAIERGDLWPT